MSHIQLQFVRARGFSSWLIARFGVQKPGFSHVDIILPPGTYDGVEYERGALLGARDDEAGGKPPGVWIRPPDYAQWVRKEVLTYFCHPLAAKKAYAWALGEVSKKYDEDAIAGFIFGQAWHKKGDYICSVLAGNFLLQASVIHGNPDELQGTSPNTLYSDSLAVGALRT